MEREEEDERGIKTHLKNRDEYIDANNLYNPYTPHACTLTHTHSQSSTLLYFTPTHTHSPSHSAISSWSSPRGRRLRRQSEQGTGINWTKLTFLPPTSLQTLRSEQKKYLFLSSISPFYVGGTYQGFIKREDPEISSPDLFSPHLKFDKYMGTIRPINQSKAIQLTRVTLFSKKKELLRWDSNPRHTAC